MEPETTVTVNGVPVEAAASLVGAIDQVTAARPVADYLIVRDGQPVALIRWDGVQPFDAGAGAEVVKADEWRGAPWTGPPDPPEVAARRSLEDRARVLRAQLGEDLVVVDTATLAQLRAIVRRTIRASRVALALALAEQDEQA